MIAAIYARKSTDQNGVADDARSVARQIDGATKYAESKGWQITTEHIYSDEGISGAEFNKRPGFLRLLNALKPKPAFSVLIMSEESRLGRETIETAYALKQIIAADVRVFLYLDGRERTLDSPLEKAMLSLQTMADEMEREKARQRTYDAMERKARAGHVTGGRVFGYDNEEQQDFSGKRSHVTRTINADEAAVVRRIFDLSARGKGFKSIAKLLNDERALTPRPQQNRIAAWAPSSVRGVLFRTTYKGEVVWNLTRKRNRWGEKKQALRPDAEHIVVSVPELQIISDDLWAAAHDAMARRRASASAGTANLIAAQQRDGRASKYLLAGNARCAVCNGSMTVRSRDHGTRRAFFFGCGNYHSKGKSACPNGLEVPLAETDEAVLAAVEKDVLRTEVIESVINRMVTHYSASTGDDTRAKTLEKSIAAVEQEQRRLVEALAVSDTEVPILAEAVRKREEQLRRLRTDLAAASRSYAAFTPDADALKEAIQGRLLEWRRLLRESAVEGRRVLGVLLDGRLTFTPRGDGKHAQYDFAGRGSVRELIAGLVSKDFALRLASPAGFEPAFWP